jgi:hypothetical protein
VTNTVTETEPVDPYDVNITNATWTCTSLVGTKTNPYHVHVTINQTGTANRHDAVNLDAGCTGHIKLAVDIISGWDGIKIHQGSSQLHVTGYVYIAGRANSTVHQDFVQAMGGTDITFTEFQTRNNGQSGAHGGSDSIHSSWFINSGNGLQEIPTRVVCDACHFDGGGTPVANGDNNPIGSGVRNSTIVKGQSGTCIVNNGTTAMVNENNTCLEIGS